MTGFLIREEPQRHMPRKEACDHGGRDSSDAATSQGCWKRQEREEAGRTDPWHPQREPGPAHTLISDLFDEAKCVLMCSSHPRAPMQPAGRGLPIPGNGGSAASGTGSQRVGRTREGTAGHHRQAAPEATCPQTPR
uniref:Uncharacterized protein n=1 Tax=Myotis myotis TaxID=51298 RepID=A0A7J7ZYG5_MYOMY|nr:hypothetical protein mMyoMyo1_009987 [Myotis myotis]